MDDQATAARRGPFESGPILREPGPIEAGERDARYDNQPPLEERIILEFQDELERPGELGAPSISGRIGELLASAKRAPEKCDTDRIAGAMGDLCKQARDVGQRLEAAREKHNRPLLNGQRALKAKADSLIQPLLDEIGKIRQRIDQFTREESERRRQEELRAAEARRIAEEAAAAALKAQGMADQIPEDRPIMAAPPIAPPAPIARGDYGARIGTRQIKKHAIESVRQLPDRILKNPRVIEALDKVIAAEIRNGAKEIKGVRIWTETASAIR